MSSQRYERIARDDTDEPLSAGQGNLPSSPPPSFRSRASSRRRTSRDRSAENEEDRDLNDAFDAPSDDESESEGSGDQRRLVSNSRSRSQSLSEHEAEDVGSGRPPVPRRNVTEIPTFVPTRTPGRIYGNASVNDGVFANLSAKPRPGDDVEEKPPTYEQAAADATPPYWETTVLSPYATSGDPNDVFVDGLLVGSLFSFVWNALISMSFQLIGFLLTYLLHTTHAAKNGSRAGLGITLVQFGFQMRYAQSHDKSDPGVPAGPVDGIPDDPNSHNFDPDTVTGGSGGAGGITMSEWLSYALMIVGWFILIRAVSDFFRARRQEALVRSSPDRGLGVAIVAEGEHPERSV